MRVSTGEQGFRSVVTDLGPAGMRLKFVEPLKRGDEILVTLEEDVPPDAVAAVRCQVVWCRKRRFSADRLAGLRYDDSEENLDRSWVRCILDSLGLREDDSSPQRRRWIRAESALPGLLEAGEVTSLVQVMDLGVGGALLQSPQTMPVQQRASVCLGPWDELPALRLEGELVGSAEDPLLASNLHRVRFDSPPPRKLKLLGDYIIKVLRVRSVAGR